MIGLGSNRLSVCRRGGMSVTQAGRGGMEWLSVRGPSWASPYSAQATAALKAQFPTQWPTIRDYGRTTPYLEAINAFAPTDPYIMYSLIPELGMIRKLCSDATAYINTGITATDSISFECFADLYGLNSNPQCLFGVEEWYNSGAGWYTVSIHGQGGIAFRLGYYNNFVSTGLSNTATNVLLRGEVGATEFELFVNGVSKGTKTKGVVWNAPMYIFRSNSYQGYPGATASRIGSLKFFYLGGNEIAHFIPCKNPNGDDYGMLDLVGAQWYGNANSSGSFTISETPAS